MRMFKYYCLQYKCYQIPGRVQQMKLLCTNDFNYNG